MACFEFVDRIRHKSTPNIEFLSCPTILVPTLYDRLLGFLAQVSESYIVGIGIDGFGHSVSICTF